ncbi:MAG: ABC transporter permease [Acidimicrobiales bacterium]
MPEWLKALSFSRLSIIYVEIVGIVIFAIWVPTTFLASATLTGTLDQNAITGLIALAVVVPLAAGVFDLSVGYCLGATSIFCAWLLGNTSLNLVVVCLLSVVFAMVIGCINGLVVVVFEIDSFIGTLATGSLLGAAIIIISGDRDLVTGFTPKFLDLGNASVGHLTVPVFVWLGVAIVMWYILGHTAKGRQIHATGLAEVPARLAGIRTNRIRFACLVVSATISGVAGVLLTAVVSAGDPTVGPAYLIPAFAAAFLGATQFREHLFNAWGCVLAVILFGTITVGLSLANAPLWMPEIFEGVVLIVALRLSSFQGRVRIRRPGRTHDIAPPTQPATASLEGEALADQSLAPSVPGS